MSPRIIQALTTFAALCSLTPFCLAQAPVNVTVNPALIIGSESGLRYGVGLWAAMDPNVAGNAAYLRGLTNVAPKVVRYHAAEQTSGNSTRNWVDAGNHCWLTNTIKAVLDHRPPSATRILINIASFPPWLDTNADGLLDNGQTNAYAAFCANLVDIVNNTFHYGVEYWEPMNEKNTAYGSNIASLASIHNACAAAMKARDPSISIVAGAFNQPWDANIRAFCRAISNSLDVFSVHIYGGGATTNRATIYDEADMTAGISNIRSQLCGPSKVVIWVDEWNAYYAYNLIGASNMANAVGATYDGLAIKKAMLQGQAESLEIFNDADNTFGLWDQSTGALRPSGNLFKLLNQYGIGSVVSTISADSTRIESFSVLNGGRLMVALMNRSLSNQAVNLDVAGMVPAMVSTIGQTTTTVAMGSFTGIPVPADNVLIVIAHTPGPFLTASLTASNSVILSWPAGSTGFVAEQNLAPINASWCPVSNAPLALLGTNYLVLPMTSGDQFFRLQLRE